MRTKPSGTQARGEAMNSLRKAVDQGSPAVAVLTCEVASATDGVVVEVTVIQVDDQSNVDSHGTSVIR